MRTYKLEAQGLLSKFGFWDGDIFTDEVEEYYEECQRQGIPYRHGMHHDVVIAAVKKYLLPAIPFEVETVEYTTCHNPIRLASLEGIDDYSVAMDLFENESVEVTSEQIKELIKSIHS